MPCLTFGWVYLIRMRLHLRRVASVTVILFLVATVILWLQLDNRNYLLEWSPDAVYYKPSSTKALCTGDFEARVQFPQESAKNKLNRRSNWKSNLRRKHNVNIDLSDILPLNRKIPDSRPEGCGKHWSTKGLPSLSVVIALHKECPSILFRTIYSVFTRTPASILKEVVLVDDASGSEDYVQEIRGFIDKQFPNDKFKIHLISLFERKGLVGARMEGLKHVTSSAVSFLDSHMEVNVDWAQPLLREIVRNRETIAMAQLDYIEPSTLQYMYRKGYRTRYGFDWRLKFFETEFREDQLKNKSVIDGLPGVVMVGAAFVVDVKFFLEIGAYDDGMKIWGGENLELSWRTWLCGGRLVHVTCSRVGHIERDQPYDFIDKRDDVEMYNYKRGVVVWFGKYNRFVYQLYPKMKVFYAGELAERISLKKKLKCKPFKWYLQNVWPELFVYDTDVIFSGGAQLKESNPPMCLDNNNYLFSTPATLAVHYCTYDVKSQNFALTTKNQLRTLLQCVTVQRDGMDYVPYLANCLEIVKDTWQLTEQGLLFHVNTEMCLTLLGKALVMSECVVGNKYQTWIFRSQMT